MRSFFTAAEIGEKNLNRAKMKIQTLQILAGFVVISFRQAEYSGVSELLHSIDRVILLRAPPFPGSSAN